ncbi:urea carboxylase-associated family protein [Streptomyces sp. NPDC048637]|uniref:urea carboxylase-associated family protein n=1 Tax=Streptomyces sp. NPDC048637 TaxID=3155636 RepID=UPI003429DCCE
MTLPSSSKPLWGQDVAPGAGASGRVAAGQTLRIIDLEGQQVADLVSFSAENPSEHLDVTYTTFAAESWQLGKGNVFVTNLMRPIWTMTEDTCGVHYAGGGFCSRELNALFGADQLGCYETILNELHQLNAPTTGLNPASCFNVFMNFPYGIDGDLKVRDSYAQPGDIVELRAEMDLLWAVSVCQMPGPCNGPQPTPMRFELHA